MKHFLKKKIFLFVIVITNLFTITVFANWIKWPDEDVSGWLPFQTTGSFWKNTSQEFISKWISEAIKYLGLIAVVTLTIWWIMYIISFWSDDKTKRAKNVIVYSIVGVVVAMAAYLLIDIVNNIKLG